MQVEDLVKYYGSQEAVSRVLAVDKSAVSQWKTTGRVPQLRALQIEKLTDGEIVYNSEVYETKPIPPQESTRLYEKEES